MRIQDILNEGPFDNVGKKEPDPDIAAAKKAGTMSGIAQGLDKWAGTNAFGDNKAKPIADVEQDVDRLDIAAKKALLAKLQRELGNRVAPTKPQAPTPQASNPATPTTK
jgi:hypothetical protein